MALTDGHSRAVKPKDALTLAIAVAFVATAALSAAAIAVTAAYIYGYGRTVLCHVKHANKPAIYASK